jgi:hypothetical protein
MYNVWFKPANIELDSDVSEVQHEKLLREYMYRIGARNVLENLSTVTSIDIQLEILKHMYRVFP